MALRCGVAGALLAAGAPGLALALLLASLTLQHCRAHTCHHSIIGSMLSSC